MQPAFLTPYCLTLFLEIPREIHCPAARILPHIFTFKCECDDVRTYIVSTVGTQTHIHYLCGDLDPSHLRISSCQVFSVRTMAAELLAHMIPK